MSAPSTNAPMDQDLGFVGGRVYAGLVLALLLVGGIGGWSLVAELSGAIVATGSVKVDRNLKALQHRDGGIISEIAVREGDFVRKGQVLLRLDDVQTRAELSIVTSQLTELTARSARSVAERDGQDSPDTRTGVWILAEAATTANGETNLFRGDRTHRDSQKSSSNCTSPRPTEISGLDAQRIAKVNESGWSRQTIS